MDEIDLDDYDDNENDEYNNDDTCALLQLDLTVTSINLPEIQEVDTIAIAKHKAILAAQLVNGPCVVEDTSLEFHALGGMPGPYIKWFQDTLKSQGMFCVPYPPRVDASFI
jgi:inosine/xanthosine triphosphate pyrophosphatase family protein